MRNLKKILALVLALMMVLSMMVTASASFDDAASIDYPEAVEVMAAAGILNGDGTGNFNPDKALERSSAAKLIAYLMLQENVELLDKTATDFSDVPATHWASGFISYVAEKNIVVGDGTGAYNPDDAVNGYSFLKMVILALCDLGVADVMDLDTTASWNWVTNEWTVAPFTGAYTLKVRLAVAELKEDEKIDLLAGLDGVSLNGELSREQAAQIVFNALKDTKILEDTYHITETTYPVAGLTYGKWIYTNPTTKKSVDVTEAVLLDTYVESFASGTELGYVADVLEITEDSEELVDIYTNTILTASDLDAADLVDNEETVELATNLDVYVDTDGNYKFMITAETLAQASIADKAETKGENKGLYKWTFGEGITYAEKDAYTVGATYLVAVGGGKVVTEPKLAETVTGKVMSKGSDYVRIDGVKYTFADGVTVPALNAERVLYLATDGTVLKCTTVSSSSSAASAETLVYVIGFYTIDVPAVAGTPEVKNEYGEVVKEATTGSDARQDRYVQYVTLDGEIKTALYNTNTNITEFGLGQYGSKLRAITIDPETGKATFKAPSAAAIKASGITETGVKFTSNDVNYYYNTAEYVQITGKLSKATVSEGNLAGALAHKSTAWAVYTGEGSNKTISTIYYWVETASTTTPTVDPDVYTDMFIIADATSTDSALIEIADGDDEDTDPDTATVYTHEVYLAGTKVEITTYAEKLTAGVKSYEVDEYGVYTEIKNYAYVVTDVVSNLYGTLATVGTVEDYDIADIPVIDLSTKGNDAVDQGDTVIYVYNPDDLTTTAANEFAIVLFYIVDATSFPEEETEDYTKTYAGDYYVASEAGLTYALENAEAGATITLDGEDYTLPSEMTDGLVINAKGGDIKIQNNKLTSNVTIQNAKFAENVWMNDKNNGVVVFENCEFTGAYGIDYDASVGAEGLNAAQVVIKNCVFDCSNTAIHIGACTESITMTGCTIKAGKVQLGATTTDVVITIANCKFNSEAKATDSIWGERGIRVYGTTTFVDCQLNNNVVVMAGSNDLPITFDGCTKDGVGVTSEIIKGGNVPVLVIK